MLFLLLVLLFRLFLLFAKLFAGLGFHALTTKRESQQTKTAEQAKRGRLRNGAVSQQAAGAVVAERAVGSDRAGVQVVKEIGRRRGGHVHSRRLFQLRQ